MVIFVHSLHFFGHIHYVNYHRRWSHQQAHRWKCRVQSLFHQATPQPQQTVRAIPELYDPALWGPGGPSGPSERQSEGRGRGEGDGHGQQRPGQPQECEQRPLRSGGPSHKSLAVRTGLTTWVDTVITNRLTTTHGVEGKDCDDTDCLRLNAGELIVGRKVRK